MNIAACPAQIIAINGSSTGPWAPAPSSTFEYDVEVITEAGSKIFRGCSVSEERYPDTLDCTPIRIGSLTTAFVIGTTRCIIAGRELPYFKACENP